MEGKNPDLDGEITTGEPTNSKSPIKKNPLIFVLVGVIVVLALALIITATPLRDVFLTAKTIPEITLELVVDPELEESGQYRFDVQAEVSGNPVPEVTFSRDDNLGEAGENRVVIFLSAGESFVLTAVAKNSQGSREASLELIAAIETVENGEEDDGEENEGIIESENLGTIEGYIVYPSDHIPDMTIVAEEVDTNEEYTTDIIIQDSKYATGFGFLIQVPPGNYHVYAIKPGDDFKAYYDEYMQSNYELDSHEKVLIGISDGQHVDDVVVGNWWKVPPNQDPVITAINLPSGPFFRGETYTISAQASDPDGDFITFDWEVSGEGFTPIHTTGNPMTLTTSEEMQLIEIKVRVRDTRGGEAVKSQEVFVHPVLTLVPMPVESGYIVKDAVVYTYIDGVEGVYVGDTSDNKMVRGFISFNTEFGIGGPFTVHRAVLRLANPHQQGDPTSFHGNLGLWVGMVDWGPRTLELSDYNLPGTGIKSFTNHDITLVSIRGEDTEKLAKEIENRLYLGADRLQFRLHFAKDNSNNNNDFDGVSYRYENIVLKVFMTLDG